MTDKEFNISQKLDALRSIISQGDLTEITIASRPPFNGFVDESDMGIPAKNVKSVYVSDSLILDEFKDEWKSLLLKQAKEINDFLLKNRASLKT